MEKYAEEIKDTKVPDKCPKCGQPLCLTTGNTPVMICRGCGETVR